MLAFVRGPSAWGGGPGEIYVKLLPDGEPVQLTKDNRIKGNPKFSPDGARISYTTTANNNTLDTWIVPVLGGQARPFLANASGLTWIPDNPPSVLFSELTGRGFQMSIVSSTESRIGLRTVYLPPETGMAHRSYLSPDRKQVLLVEMLGGWLPCRLTPFDGSSPGKPVGPAPAQCTDAAWSPDGKWMYFPPIPETDITSGASVSRTGRPSKSPPASPTRKGFISLATGGPSSPRSATDRARCGSTILAASAKSRQKASRFPQPSQPMGRKCFTSCGPGECRASLRVAFGPPIWTQDSGSSCSPIFRCCNTPSPLMASA